MAVKKSKPGALPRLHEMKVDEIVAKGQERVRASRQRIQDSKARNKATRELIKDRRRKKK